MSARGPSARSAIDPDGALSVSHPDRGEVQLPARYAGQHVELGWAATGYGTQGDTVDIGIAVLDAGSTRNHTYVAMTRGRHANYAMVIDPTGTIDPAERLSEIIARPANSESALAVRHRLHYDAGVPEPDEPERTVTKPSQPGPPAPSVDPDLDQNVARITARLDALQARTLDRTLGRGLTR